MSKEYESEAMLEEKLIKHLELLGYTRINLKNLDDVKENFRKQVNKHNIDELKGKELSDREFDRLYTMITGKGVYASSKILREKQCLERDNGEKIYITKWQKESIDKAKKIFDAFEEIPYSEHQDEWDESYDAIQQTPLKSCIKSIEKFVDEVKDDYDNYVHYNTTRVLGENLVEDIPAPPGMLSFKQFFIKDCKDKMLNHIAKIFYSKEK